ncbi:hypothetical protein B0H16DRAFT_414097 [Mycena metata]|uniref:Uncharacterized protein n=1 Tax=Mycena metata TaxID=1033252 RepID=A0AAD7NL04_9AGAR|nr:hypothetical protein B0H16DRAFT_414097 [Mycena metata]
MRLRADVALLLFFSFYYPHSHLSRTNAFAGRLDLLRGMAAAHLVCFASRRTAINGTLLVRVCVGTLLVRVCVVVSSNISSCGRVPALLCAEIGGSRESAI